jgi:hypothetical protein
MSNKDEIVRRLAEQLDLAHDVRTSIAIDAAAAARREALRSWQAARLARTHADLLASSRYGPTAAFFLTDIYGPQDLSRHEAEVRRVLPVMTRLLPASGLETVADAIELNALSERLDAAMIGALGEVADKLTPAGYGSAYRAIGQRPQREQQIELMGHLGRSLERLTRSALIGWALSAMRKPAHLAGLDDLQAFLERGYAAFRNMGRADEFLQTIVSREKAVLEALFAGDDSVL